MKYRSGDNPAAWKGALSHLLPAISKIQRIEHHKAMPYEQVPVFMRDLVRNDSTSAKALVFTILTGARTRDRLLSARSWIRAMNGSTERPRQRLVAHNCAAPAGGSLLQAAHRWILLAGCAVAGNLSDANAKVDGHHRTFRITDNGLSDGWLPPQFLFLEKRPG